jgi:transposase-like protein
VRSAPNFGTHSRGLGFSAWNLRDWKKLYGTGATVASQPQACSAALASAGGPGAAAAVEIAAIQRELASLRRQNDILKKPWLSSPSRMAPL